VLVMSAKVMDFERESRRCFIERRSDSLACVICVVGRGLQSRGQGQGLCTEKTLGWSVDLVERARKAAPEEVLRAWAREWAKEGMKVGWERIMAPKDYERFLFASGEALVYAAMIRLMTRRLVRT
jgi:hypothetical protein